MTSSARRVGLRVVLGRWPHGGLADDVQERRHRPATGGISGLKSRLSEVNHVELWDSALMRFGSGRFDSVSLCLGRLVGNWFRCR